MFENKHYQKSLLPHSLKEKEIHFRGRKNMFFARSSFVHVLTSDILRINKEVGINNDKSFRN